MQGLLADKPAVQPKENYQTRKEAGRRTISKNQVNITLSQSLRLFYLDLGAIRQGVLGLPFLFLVRAGGLVQWYRHARFLCTETGIIFLTSFEERLGEEEDEGEGAAETQKMKAPKRTLNSVDCFTYTCQRRGGGASVVPMYA